MAAKDGCHFHLSLFILLLMFLVFLISGWIQFVPLMQSFFVVLDQICNYMWDFHINTNVFDVKVNKQMRPEMFYANPSNPALIGKSQMSK